MNKTASQAPTPTTAYIGLGSNLASPMQQLTEACKAIRHSEDITLEAISPWYQSVAVGPEQPDYINGAVKITTTLEPEALLDTLQAIELAHGRERKIHWGPRTLDLDILLYGDQQINTDRLTVPHAYMSERNFVVYPLADIAPNLTLPNGTTLTQLKLNLGEEGLRKLTKSAI